MTTRNKIRKIAVWAKDLDQDVRLYAVRIARYQDRDIIRAQVKEIRSTKHTIDAIAFDSLGNMIALCGDGITRQYVTDQEVARAGIR